MTALEPGAASRHKRGGRRDKTAWRKNVDLRDVESFLEDQRLDERLGRISDKSDAELFAVDVAGDAGLTDAADNARAAPILVSSKRSKRAALAATTPRCHLALQPTSQVQDPSGGRNTVRAPGSRAGDLSRRSAARRAAGGPERQRRAQQAARDALAGRERRRSARRSRGRFDTDVWAAQSASALAGGWLDEDGVRHNERPPPAPPAARAPRRPAPPAVPAPHPGQSYNPSYQEHQALLRAVCDTEQRLMAKERHLARVTTALYTQLRPEQAKSEWLKEMMSGLPEPPRAVPAAAAAAASSDSDSEYRAVNPPVRNKKKDARARRRQKEMRQEMEDRRRLKVEKKKVADLYKLRFLERSLAATEARLTRAREQRGERRRARLATTPPALNAHKHAPAEEAFLAPEELAPALRASTHTGQLLRERFVSLQRRGLLAPSRIFLRKKLRLKRFWKPGHKVTAADVARHAARTQQ